VNYIKQADLVFLGFEAPADSIFFVLLRSIRYSMLFTWHWHAKRTGELEEVGQFDAKFPRQYNTLHLICHNGEKIGSFFCICATVVRHLVR